MAFRLNRRRSITTELEKLVHSEFQTAIKELDQPKPGADAIHEARKSLKKIRAVLRLLRNPLGHDYGPANRRLRDVAHRLASLRDVDATSETLRALHHRYPTVITPGVTRAVAHGLRPRKRQARAKAGPVVRRATGMLRRSRHSTPRRIRRVQGFSAVRAGVKRGYRRARGSMDEVSLNSDFTQFHAWRRGVKDHWYHVRLFEGLHPTPRSRARTLKRLETWLGDDHNLGMLRATILDAPDRFGNARTTALVLGCITKYQASLRRDALKLGHRLFAEKPGRFERTVDDWWNSSSNGKKS